MAMTFLTTPQPPTEVFKVGCRVDGVIQQYEIVAVDAEEAAKICNDGVANAKPILVLITNKGTE